MRRPLWAGLLSAAAFIAGSDITLAHHSNAVVDKDKLITKTGKITKFAFAQPHVSIYLTVHENGTDTSWYAGGASPTVLGKIGWTNKTIKPGEKMVIQGNPARDGRPLMSFRGLYRCTNGEQVATSGDPDAPTRAYVSRVKIPQLDKAQVKALCDAAPGPNSTAAAKSK
jgi:hypothetical protein